MYKIKPNGKFVLLITDLGLTVSYDSLDAYAVSDADFERSVDI